MDLSWLFRFFTRGRKTSTSSTESTPETRVSQQPQPRDTLDSSTNAVRAASNALQAALQASVSGPPSVAAVLPPSITDLVAITKLVETAVNDQGLIQLAGRIELLVTAVSEMGGKNPIAEQALLKDLQREMQSITNDLQVAFSEGKLDRFFTTAHNLSPLEKHNMVLTRLVTDSTFVGVNEVREWLHELESGEASSPGTRIVLGDVAGENAPGLKCVSDDSCAGGGAGTGGSAARVGGEGRESERPRLHVDPSEHWNIGNISGGIGSAGGDAVEVDGKGGAGKGPVVSASRRNKAPRTEP